MRHQRLLARFGFLFSVVSLIDEAFSFKDLMLLGRANEVGEEVGSCSESSSRGADVGGGPRDAIDMDDCDESDRREGESSTGIAGIGDARSLTLERFVVDNRGLWTADGFGLPCTL